VQVQPGSALINITSGRYLIGVQPVLDFFSRSPDRCWVLFATRAMREGPPRMFTGIRRDGDWLDLSYANDTQSLLRVSRLSITEIESYTRLDQPIYSHLNTYCELTITGHRRLFIQFSPCPQIPIEVTAMEYPRGRPERLAYLDQSEIFHVVEAASAEKGPYHELAAGKLSRGEPLSLVLSDQQTPMFRITFDDWTSQSSVAPSPTAGYGLPETAIEFSLAGVNPSSAASVFLTLAATSAGRGYNSVGHNPGIYVNRMRIERLIH
jgi:hypothetical protein